MAAAGKIINSRLSGAPLLPPTYSDNETMRIVNSFCHVTLARFEDRIRLQKLGYLAQALGASGGFMFSWYHRGPYSPTLTKELYRYESQGRLGAEQRLTRRERGVVARMRDLLGDGIDSSYDLELYASLWYFFPRRRAATAGDADSAVDELLSRKPQFTREEAAGAASAILKFKRRMRR